MKDTNLGSYNGSTPGSEPVNEGPTPSPKALHKYGWRCKCKAELDMEITKLLSIPECLLCGEQMYMMYSINPKGEIWMNRALLLEDAVD